ncbi:MAG: restriction endonuclease [bacterium]|nr:restriction endonuclease [bacterium]
MADTDGDNAPTAWLIRAGRHGEHEDFNLDNGLAGLGWTDIPDLRGVANRDGLRKLIRDTNPDDKKRSVSAQANQLWRFKTEVHVGDLVVLPLKTTGQIALGTVTREYWYRNVEDSYNRHVVSVEWKRTDLPRSDVEQDLLYSLGSLLTICSITRNDGAWRLQQLMLGGRDPGRRSNPDLATERRDRALEDDTPEATDAVDLEAFARDRIRAFIGQKFTGHDLSRLVARVLEAEGFITETSPPGPDGGIDVLAGRGPLGLDTPRIVVQVKSGTTPVGAPVLRELNGVLSTQGADQGLLVAWGGVTRTTRREQRDQFFRVRVWDAEDLMDAVFRNYDKFDEELQAELRLKQVWTLIED